MSSRHYDQQRFFASHQQVKLYLLALIFQDRGMILKSACPLWKILVILKFARIKAFQDLETYTNSTNQLNKFVGPISRRSRQNLPEETRREVLRRHNIYVSLRQSSEWGMRSLQGTFTRMKSRLTSIKRKRKLILSVIILLHNFRTEVVGLNQIATVLMLNMSRLLT